MIRKIILDPDSDGKQWKYRGFLIVDQTHPVLLKYAVYEEVAGEEPIFIDVSHTKRGCISIINKQIKTK